MYRRKKKPRLEDCTTGLAQLRSENETLGRHLANITDKTALVDQEREQAEKKLSEMVRGGATEASIGPVLDRFGEMYSDYGRRRQEELTFHLFGTVGTACCSHNLNQNDALDLRPIRPILLQAQQQSHCGNSNEGA